MEEKSGLKEGGRKMKTLKLRIAASLWFAVVVLFICPYTLMAFSGMIYLVAGNGKAVWEVMKYISWSVPIFLSILIFFISFISGKEKKEEDYRSEIRLWKHFTKKLTFGLIDG